MECFLIEMRMKPRNWCRQSTVKRLTAAHLKVAIIMRQWNNWKSFDFRRLIRLRGYSFCVCADVVPYGTTDLSFSEYFYFSVVVLVSDILYIWWKVLFQQISLLNPLPKSCIQPYFFGIHLFYLLCLKGPDTTCREKFYNNGLLLYLWCGAIQWPLTKRSSNIGWTRTKREWLEWLWYDMVSSLLRICSTQYMIYLTLAATRLIVRKFSYQEFSLKRHFINTSTVLQ